MLDLGTVVGQEHDSRDLFEKVFQRLDADSSLDVTRAEFKRYFCPLDEAHDARQRAPANDEASRAPGSPSGRPAGAAEAPRGATSERSARLPQPPRSPRAPPALGQSSVSVFSQASGSARDDWPPSPPPPTGGCCGIGAKRARAPPRAAAPRAAAYRAPGASPLAASSAGDSVSNRSPQRSPPKPFRVTAARKGDGAARAPPSPLHASSPAAEKAAEKVAEKVVEKVVEKKVYNISDEELASLKEELELLREQVRSKGETLRSKDARLGEMEKENTALRAEYNLQSLKQEMLVHMWSMHMLDADAEDDAST